MRPFFCARYQECVFINKCVFLLDEKAHQYYHRSSTASISGEVGQTAEHDI